MLDDLGPFSQSLQTNLKKPIWGTPNLLDPGAPEYSSLAQHGQNRPGVTVTGLKETKPGLEGPQCVGSAQENWKWGIEASERLWTIFKNILLAWFDITTYPLVIIYLNIRKLVQWEWPLVINQPKGQRLPWRSTYIMYVCMSVCLSACMHAWMDVCMYGWMDAWRKLNRGVRIRHGDRYKYKCNQLWYRKFVDIH